MSYIPKLAAGIRMDGNGLAKSINAMQMDMDIMGIFAENIVGFDKTGYQRKEAVISSFAEYIGTNALSYNTDTQIGRLVRTDKPLDLALSEKGYFQVVNKDGSIELTRDGRFIINKDGEILTQTGQKVLSAGGEPLILPVVPEDTSLINIGLDGKIGVFDKEKRGLVSAGRIGVVSANGEICQTNGVRQGYVESSNVSLEKEYLEVSNYQRSFDANRQMFKIQNNKLSDAIQTLGRV